MTFSFVSAHAKGKCFFRLCFGLKIIPAAEFLRSLALDSFPMISRFSRSSWPNFTGVTKNQRLLCEQCTYRPIWNTLPQHDVDIVDQIFHPNDPRNSRGKVYRSPSRFGLAFDLYTTAVRSQTDFFRTLLPVGKLQICSSNGIIPGKPFQTIEAMISVFILHQD